MTFGFDRAWGASELADAHLLYDDWTASPATVDLSHFGRVYFSLEYCLRYRAITNYARHADAWQLRLDFAELCEVVFPTRWVPLAELAHIETRTFPDRLASVREGWTDKTRNIPIYLTMEGERLVLVNGNHRLTTAREHGVPTILAAIAPECLDYTKAKKREDAFIASMKADDLGPFGYFQCHPPLKNAATGRLRCRCS